MLKILSPEEMQIKTIMRYYFTTHSDIYNQKERIVGKNVEKLEPSLLVGMSNDEAGFANSWQFPERLNS